MTSVLVDNELVEIPDCPVCGRERRYLVTIEAEVDYFGDWRPRRRMFRCDHCNTYVQREAT